MSRCARGALLCGAGVAAAMRAGLARGLPGGVTRVLVGFPAGGGTDATARSKVD